MKAKPTTSQFESRFYIPTKCTKIITPRVAPKDVNTTPSTSIFQHTRY